MYKKIRQAIGIKNVVVSGGGSLASHLDDFFELLGLQVVNGWGLSEVNFSHLFKDSHSMLYSETGSKVRDFLEPFQF